jgi:aminoglycoside/choline kinase family phosphotransferase
MEKLINLFESWHKDKPVVVSKLPGAGSNREYYRLTDKDGHTYIGVVGNSRDEDHAFVYLSHHFSECKLPVPQVLAVSEDELRYIQTDLGSVSLFDAIKGGREADGRYNQHEKQLLVNTIRELPNIQITGASGLEWSNCYPQPEF